MWQQNPQYNLDVLQYDLTKRRLWDGTVKALFGVIRVDGVAYRFMGPTAETTTPTINQTSVQVSI
jgi:hypothetical protein